MNGKQIREAAQVMEDMRKHITPNMTISAIHALNPIAFPSAPRGTDFSDALARELADLMNRDCGDRDAISPPEPVDSAADNE